VRPSELISGVLAGDRRAIARSITLLEDGDSAGWDVVRGLHSHTGHAFTIGLTGPPGVGKSTLVGGLIAQARESDQDVAVLSVDPSSPFTRGAVLGDRIRLSDHILDARVYMRSMATRGHLGGLSEATSLAMMVLDAAGKDVILLETVGTGQTEVEVAALADTVVLVLMPGSGDAVQALKAGIMEIPDIIVVNKREHPQARVLAKDLRSVLALDRERRGEVPILLTQAPTGEGVAELWTSIGTHRRKTEARGGVSIRRQAQVRTQITRAVMAHLAGQFEDALMTDACVQGVLVAVQNRELDPVTAVERIIHDVFGLGLEDASAVLTRRAATADGQ
jgi:LAO/AO transport system kinase